MKIRLRALFVAFFVICVSAITVAANAAPAEFRVLLDVDNDATTGCTVAGMQGVEQVFTTRIETTASAASVTRTVRQVCSIGSLGAAINVDTTGWPAGFQAASGNTVVESRLPFALLGSGSSHGNMRIGIQGQQGAAVHTAIVRPDGSPANYPGVRGKRRAVGTPGEARVITLDGNDNDWFGISPLFTGIASGGSAGLRIIRFSAFSDVEKDILYFLFHANLSTDAPVAEDDHYSREEGEGLAVPAPGVLANDSDPNGLPLTATPVSPAARGTVTLNPDGSFTYTPNDPASTLNDAFEYKATNGTKDSSPARVHINVASDANSAPVFTSSNTRNVVENTTNAGAITATDADGDSVTFSITGGADAARFSIAGGSLVFNSAPDFEAPADSGADNQYVVQVTANDGQGGQTVQTITVTVTNANEDPSFTSPTTASVPENTTAVLTVTVDDPDGDAISYSLAAGADAARFSIGPSSGVLTFNPAPDFEAPADTNADNQYVVTVRANDGGTTIQTTITVTVTNVNEGPAFTSSNTATIAENTTAVLTVTTSDPEGNAVTYSITGGADAALFTINSTTGALAFTAAPNFEAPADSGANNIYNIQVTATDGATSTAQNLTVTVTDVNEAPVFTSAATANVPENSTTVLTATTNDPEGNTVTYSVSGGADAARFSINAATGALSFNAAPDFEAPADADANNVYVVQISATDGTNSVNATINVTVTNVNEAPLFTSANSASIAENTTAVLTVTAADAEGSALTYSISGGADAALFTIDSTTGALAFTSAPNFETPADSDGNNVYLVQVTANDGANNAVQSISVTVTNVNEPAVFTSPSSASVPENTAAVMTVAASDPENAGIAYSISGGADAARFSINASTGALSFNTLPNFEAPTDADANNVYLVQVTANDGSSNTSQTISVTVTNTNDAPVFTTGNAFSTAENTTAITTVAASDEDGNAITYSITGGADAAHFAINPTTGVLTFTAPKNFEAPADADANNVYVVQVTANDGPAAVAQTISVTVTNVDEAPVFTSTATPSVPENTTAVVTVATTDPEGQAVTYSITGGADAAQFSINAVTGALTFNSLPDFESSGDADNNNQYLVQVTANDGTNPVMQSLTVTVTDVNEAPAFTSSNAATISENTLTAMTVTTNDQEGNSVAFSISGGADAARFSIDSSTGVLTFNAAPDFEAPADADGNNQYVVQVTATDGTTPVSQTITITVTDVNEAPVFTSGATVNVAEGTTAVTTVAAVDPDGTAPTYSITGGADMALFSINAATGALTFNAAPNFEAPADADANNQYVVEVTAGDGTNNTPQTITVTVTNVNEAPAFTSSATPSIAENATAAVTVTTTDAEGDTITYSITGGADAALFSINSSTGAVTFNSAPNFEAPADAGANNVYDILVTANDGTNAPTQNISITVTNVNEAPSFTSSASLSAAENQTAAGTVTTTDQEGNTITYSITGGADAALFTINSATGVLTFNSAPNFEAPADAGANNVYDLVVTASDGTNAPTQNVTVTVTDVNEAPTFTSGATPSIAENTTAAVTVTTTDAEGNTITYSISGGADAALFSINSTTGAVTFNSAPNFEAPADAGANNVYDIIVTANDGTNAPTQNVTITVTDVNEAPAFTSSATPSAAENQTSAITVTSTDQEGNTITYSISGGADAALFSINSSTGVVTFNSAPNFEAPADADANNVYQLVVTASDGTNAPTQAISVTVTDVNEAPSFTSSAAPSVVENTTAAVTVTTTDAEGHTITYSISGGADAALFSINTTTGAVTFNSAPNFEAPADAGANNVYDIVVTANDGTNAPTQAIAITVTDANEAPAFTSSNSMSAAENQTAAGTVTTTDQEGNTITYSISGGADAALFAIDSSTGVLTFNSAPNFEAPADAGANNVYDIVVTANDGTNSPTQNIAITVTDVNEAPSFTSSAAPSVTENTTAAVTVTTTDAEGNTITYSISGGADAALFSINTSTGAVTFNSAPNFEAPADAGGDNVYDIVVTASDGTNAPTQAIAITVTDANEAPVFTSSAAPSVAENQTAAVTVTSTDAEGNTITYSITGGADAALFSIDGATGALTFNSAPNFEAPADASANNVYDVVVTANDGTNTPTQAIAVTVTNVNEAPAFTSSAAPSVAENQTAAVTVTTSDPEGNTVTYSITGGADAALFSINTSTGALTFNSAPNFDVPADAGANNVYDVDVTATDGTNSPVQSIAVTVTDVNEAPSFTSSASPAVAENGVAVVTVATTDPEGNTITYSITGGADAALFSIDSSTGALTFNSAPNYEAPADAGANNVYDVVVTAADGTNSPTQTISVTVTNIDEGPSFTSGTTANFAENGSGTAATAAATDPEGDAVTYSITGGADAGDLAIDATTGAVTFNATPDFEAPADSDTNNTYVVEVTATSSGGTAVQTITITVTDANETPSFTSAATASVLENQTAVLTVTTSDPEGNTITYSITGGADAALFSIDSSTGALSFTSARNFEAPADAGANNVYDVVVTATDGTNSPTQAIAVTVTNADEAPAFTSSASPSAAENQTAVITVAAVDQEGQTITYSITGGADAALFTIGGMSGVLTFNSAPNFEAPADAGANNVYDVVVTASDGTNAPTQAIAVTVTDANEPPVFTSSATPSAAENQTAVVTVATTDVESDTIAYSITGGADSALFSINSTSGALTFLSAPNFEAPADAGANNVYDVVVTASDGTNAPTQAIAVTVTNVNEAPSITSGNSFSVAENSVGVTTVTATDPEGQTLTYSITGGADQGDFTIDGSTGVLTFTLAPNFEAPADSDGDNIYTVQVAAGDGTNSPTQTITVTVTNVEEGPAFTSPTATANFAENSTGTVLTATATDPEGDAVTYTITGGTDSGDLTVDTSTGAITFNVVPNYEAPVDSDTNNTYVIEVTATSTGGTAVQTITITVTDVNEQPVITSGNTANVNENVAAVMTVTATDPDGTTPTYAISGGADAGDFTINATTGALTFTVAPNFEAPADADTDNVYVVTVRATDGTLFDDDTITVTVANVNEAPTAAADAYNYLGNTELRIDGHAGNAAALAFTTSTTNPIDNDSDPDSIASGFGTINIVAVAAGTSAQGGTYRLETDGTMFYTPPAGHTGADSITYQLTDGTNTVNGTMNFTMTGTDVVWYVKNDDPTADGTVAKDGTSSFPHNTLAAASAASDVNEIIYVHSGDGTTNGQNSGIVLKNGQKLYGRGIALVVNSSTTLIAAGSQPQIGNAAGAGVTAVNLSNVQIKGLNIGGSTDAIFASTTVANSGSIEISTNPTRAPGPAGIDIDGGGSGTFAVSVHDNSIVSTGNAIDINRTAGALYITAFGGNSISGVTGGSGIVVTAATFDSTPATAAFTQVAGGITSIGSSGDGVGVSGMVLTNVAGDLAFTSLNIVNSNGTGLFASSTTAYTGSAGFQLTANSGTDVIASTGGPAVNISTARINLTPSSIGSTGSATFGVNLDAILTGSTFTAGATSSITSIGAAATAFRINNSAVSMTYNGTINITQGAGVALTSNTGGTYAFTGVLTLSTAANSAFVSTGTATVTSNNTASTITTTTGAAVNIATTIGAAGVTFRSVNSTTVGSNVTIALANTGSGAFTITGVGTTAASGGTIDNKTADAVTLNNTGGLVTLKNMVIEDIGSTAGAFHTISGHDAIHGQQVSGGLTLDNVTIRRISDNAIHGATLAGNAATTWSGLTVTNSTFQFTNRYHVAGSGDANNEGMIRINGVQGTVTLTNNTFEDSGEHVDFFVTAGTLNMTATANNFNRSYKEFTSGTTASIGNQCVDVTVQGTGSANITIGDASNVALGNDFLNCRLGSVRIVNDTGSTGSVTTTIGKNNFVSNDHSSGFGGDFDFPMGGVLVWSLAAGTTNARITGNYFDETTRASGALGSIGVLADLGTFNARIDNNTFDTLGDGTWVTRSKNGATARVQVDHNTYINGFFSCPDTSCAGGYTGPALYQLAEAQEGGTLHLTNTDETYSAHDTGYYPGNSLEARVNNIGAASTMCVALSNLKAPQGYSLNRYAGTFNLFKGASPFTGVCTTAQCQSVLQSNNNLGGGGNPNLSPPTVELDGGVVNVISTSCQLPSGSIF